MVVVLVHRFFDERCGFGTDDDDGSEQEGLLDEDDGPDENDDCVRGGASAETEAAMMAAGAVAGCRLSGNGFTRLPSSRAVWARLSPTLVSLCLNGNSLVELPAAIAQLRAKASERIPAQPAALRAGASPRRSPSARRSRSAARVGTNQASTAWRREAGIFCHGRHEQY